MTRLFVVWIDEASWLEDSGVSFYGSCEMGMNVFIINKTLAGSRYLFGAG